VLDDGAAVFDLAQAKYSISGERNKCLLHLGCHGLEFAKVRLAHHLGSLRSTPEIVFGVGGTSACSENRTRMSSADWCTAWEKCVMPMVREIMHCGGCIQGAGWNRWWCRT
jgi:hypothetical protein